MMIVAIVQARMMSTRLPGKVLRTIVGKPMLVHIIDRVRGSHLIDKIVVATTTESEDTAITRVAQECGVDVYRGSANDLLDRFYQAAKMHQADVIVRVTADDPFKDPQIIDQAISYYLFNKGNLDFVSNVIKPSYPLGLDVEVFTFEALEKAWREVKDLFRREWLTTNFFEHPKKYRLANIEHDEDLSYMRWTVDFQDDLDFVTEIYKRLYVEGRVFLMQDILNLLRNHPELMEINKAHPRDEAYHEALGRRTK